MTDRCGRQKTFVSLRRLSCLVSVKGTRLVQMRGRKSFLLLFFKKEGLPYLLLEGTNPRVSFSIAVARKTEAAIFPAAVLTAGS